MSRERVTRSLLRLDASSGFVAQHREPAVGLGIEVDDVGRCEFPLTADRIAALVERAVPSPFGYRDETRHDPTVRSSWEIPAARLHLPTSWSRRFDRGLQEIVAGLGLPPEREVTAVLQKLIIYAPGQFFARHRDSQTNPGTAGTLVVVLPSAHRGGDLRISHADADVTISSAKDASANYLSFVGFYADCPHETRPVESGHRVVLSYALEVEPQALAATKDGASDLEHSIRAYFTSDDAPEWLVYVLDHQYSEQSIEWSRLKREDRVRVAALLDAAERTDCECFLALADTHETREYEGDEDDDGEDDEVYDPDDPTAQRCLPSPLPDRQDDTRDVNNAVSLVAGPDADVGGRLVDIELTLTAWIDRDGQPCPGTDRAADRECVVSTCDFDRHTAYETAAEPWTGNEGGTSEKWYSQAALVVIPRGSDLHAEIRD